MSAVSQRVRIKEAVEAAGNAWLFESAGTHLDQILGQLEQGIEEFVVAYQAQFGERQRPDPFGLLETNRAKGMAFFQVSTLRASVPMKIMIWRILQGCEVKRVEFHYDSETESTLSIVLQTPYGEEDPPYTGDPLRDFGVLRHFGATGVNGRLLLQGYYASR
jgi:hypothetical protein